MNPHGGDEVAHTTRAFARMRYHLQRNEADKQKLEEELRQSQKMEALGSWPAVWLTISITS